VKGGGSADDKPSGEFEIKEKIVRLRDKETVNVSRTVGGSVPTCKSGAGKINQKLERKEGAGLLRIVN